jgi:hypothetical protein
VPDRLRVLSSSPSSPLSVRDSVISAAIAGVRAGHAIGSPATDTATITSMSSILDSSLMVTLPRHVTEQRPESPSMRRVSAKRPSGRARSGGSLGNKP